MLRKPNLSIWIGAMIFMEGTFLIFVRPNIVNSVESQITGNIDVKLRSSVSVPPDAFLEAQPLYLVEKSPPVSRVHCLSDNFQPDAWLYRSCHFENMCFDLETKSFVLHPSKRQQHLESHLHNQTYLSSLPQEMISGGQHMTWLKQGRSKWIPESRSTENVTSYYKLSEDTVWISFYPWADCNAGHLLWDSFLPIYTLLDIFNLVDKKLFLTEMQSPSGGCRPLVRQYGQMMGLTTGTMPQVISNLSVSNARSNLVCARNSANGMGWLTDHGLNLHGVRFRDFNNPHNIFRSSSLVRFRNYLLDNAGIKTPSKLRKPYQVIFSILSSKDKDRRFDFANQIASMKEALPDSVRVEGIALWNYTVMQQVELATKTAVFISVGGGGTSPAFFLPSGACLIMYGKDGERFDWDLWNNYAQVRTHWLTLSHLDSDTHLLVDLVRTELDLMEALAST